MSLQTQSLSENVLTLTNDSDVWIPCAIPPEFLVRHPYAYFDSIESQQFIVICKSCMKSAAKCRCGDVDREDRLIWSQDRGLNQTLLDTLKGISHEPVVSPPAQPTAAVNNQPGVVISTEEKSAPASENAESDGASDEEIIQDAADYLKTGQGQDAAQYLVNRYDCMTLEEAQELVNRAQSIQLQPEPEVPDALTFFERIALPLATARDWKVVPLFPNLKQVHTTLVPEPLTMMSNDPKTIHEWGLKEPNANVGVYAVQEPGGLVFLDKDGAISLRRKYEQETGKKFPETLLVRSSVVDVNGRSVEKGHWYFLQTPRTIGLGNNIPEDKTGGLFSLRVHHQYVCSVGSLHPKTGMPYEIAEDYPVIEMPDDLLDWLLGQIAAKPNTREAVKQRGLFHKGTRYPALISEAGRLWQRGYSAEDVIDTATKWARENFDVPEGVFDESLVRREVKRIVDAYPQGEPANELILINGMPAGTNNHETKTPVIPVVDDPGDNDSRFEMIGEAFDTKVYEDMALRFTPYPDPGEGDLISQLAHKLVHGTSIPLAYVREPLKAIVLHALDGKLAHPGYSKMSLRGNYFSLGESESGKTTGLEFAMAAAEQIMAAVSMQPENLFRYKSETTFIRSFTPEGTIKRNADGAVKSGRPGHASQFLYIKEGNLVANCSDYFGAVFSQLTNLYDQTEAGTESMTNGDFTAGLIKASTVMCFTPSDYKATFGGKGTIGGGGLNRWGLANPPENRDYDDKDWVRLDDSVIQAVIVDLARRIFELLKHERTVLIEEPGAHKIRLEVKSALKKAGKVGKRLLDYFMREQVAMAATASDQRLVMTTEQAAYAKSWVEAQLACRVNCWPADSVNQIETMEHAIRKAVNTHFVSETRLKDVCHFYREGSGGWFVFSTALKNAQASEAIKLTGNTRKKVRVYCPVSCSDHPAIKEDDKPRKK